MGGAVSAGQSNEELVDNLCHEGYIHEPRVEKVNGWAGLLYLLMWRGRCYVRHSHSPIHNVVYPHAYMYVYT